MKEYIIRYISPFSYHKTLLDTFEVGMKRIRQNSNQGYSSGSPLQDL